jgi:hypothetical protein
MRVREALSVISGIALVALATATMSAQGAGSDNPDVTEVRNYVLTLAKAQATATAMQSINQLVAANPSLNAALSAGSDTTGKKPITQQARDIDSQYPQIATITGAIINDVGFVGMKMQGMITAYPPNSITPANAAFVEANWATFQTIAAKMTPPQSN